jgi:multidrug transporter EmrE-like cation transporter
MNEHFIKTLQFVFLLGLLETISKISLKYGTMKGSIGDGNGVEKYLIFGIICYGTIAYGLWHSFKIADIGQMNLMWNAVTTTTAFISGYLLFKEEINRYTIYSILLLMLALYFSYLSEIKQ